MYGNDKIGKILCCDKLTYDREYVNDIFFRYMRGKEGRGRHIICIVNFATSPRDT